MHNDFQELEQQLEKLIQLSERLNQENHHLRKQQAELKRARAELLKQRDQARQNIDAVLGGSKTMSVVMTEIATVRVQILGREFPVACPAGQERELEAAAEFVDNRMREIQEKPAIARSNDLQ